MTVNIKLIHILIILTIANLSTANNLNTKAKLRYYKSKSEESKISVMEKMSLYDSILNLLSTGENKKELVYYMIKKADLAYDNGDYTKAFNVYRDINTKIDEYGQKMFVDEKKESMIQMSKSALNIGMFDESISCLFDLIKYNDDKDLNYKVCAYSLLGLLFMNMDKIAESEKYHYEAMTILKHNDTLNNKTKLIAYSSYAGLFYIKKQYDSTLKYMNIAEHYCKKLNDSKHEANLYHNFAITYQGIKEYAIAEEYFKKVLNLTSDEDLSYSRVLSTFNLGFLYLETGKINEALQRYEQAIKDAEKIGAIKIKSSALIEMSEIYYKKGDYKKSRDYFKLGQTIKDSIFNVQNLDRIVILRTTFEARKNEMEKELMKQNLKIVRLDNEKKNIILIVLCTLIAISITLTIIVLNKLIRQRKRNNLLNNTINNLHRQNVDEFEATKQNFEQTIELKNRELTSTALCLIKANEILTSLKQDISKKNRTEEGKVEISPEIISVISSYNTDQGWNEFKLYFEQIHRSFYKKLDEINPELTNIEQRLCALIVLNMNAKEIALLTNRSVRTIEALVYTIRKKLNIPTDTKTIVFLRSLID